MSTLVCINVCYGGFGLSTAAVFAIARMRGDNTKVVLQISIARIADVVSHFGLDVTDADIEDAKLTHSTVWVACSAEFERDITSYLYEWDTVHGRNPTVGWIILSQQTDAPIVILPRGVALGWTGGLMLTHDIDRTDEALIRTVMLLGTDADMRYSRLQVVEVDDGVQWYIDEYDGKEHVAVDYQSSEFNRI